MDISKGPLSALLASNREINELRPRWGKSRPQLGVIRELDWVILLSLLWMPHPSLQKGNERHIMAAKLNSLGEKRFSLKQRWNIGIFNNGSHMQVVRRDFQCYLQFLNWNNHLFYRSNVIWLLVRQGYKPKLILAITQAWWVISGQALLTLTLALEWWPLLSLTLTLAEWVLSALSLILGWQAPLALRP